MDNKQKSIKEFLATGAGKAVIMVVFYLIILCCFILAAQANSMLLALIVLLICAIPGWKFLNRITPNIFLFLPIIGFVIYFIIKGMLAFVVGIFVAPYQISKKIATTIQNNL